MSQSKILIDIPSGSTIDESFLVNAGHPVVVCHGPDHEECPLLNQGECGMAESAHGIVFMLDLEKREHREILEQYRSMLKEDLPIGVVVKDREQANDHAGLLSGLRVWDKAPVAGDLDALVAEVEAADEG